jgi:hypothetical protein
VKDISSWIQILRPLLSVINEIDQITVLHTRAISVWSPENQVRAYSPHGYEWNRSCDPAPWETPSHEYAILSNVRSMAVVRNSWGTPHFRGLSEVRQIQNSNVTLICAFSKHRIWYTHDKNGNHGKVRNLSNLLSLVVIICPAWLQLVTLHLC